MPKLYEYFGLIIFFYSNEHEPIHVHGRAQGREARADLIVRNGRVETIHFGGVVGRPLLLPQEMRYFEELVSAKAGAIVDSWVRYFVYHRSLRPVRITRRLK